MKKILITCIIILASTSFFVNTWANTEIQRFDDGSSIATTTYDDGSRHVITTDTDGKATTVTYDSDGNVFQPRGTAQSSNNNGTNILGLSDNDLRKGNVNLNTIPTVIVNVINVLLGIAGTVSIVALIYYAIRMQASSGITGDSSGVDKAKKGMFGAIIGFVIAILAWFIVTRFVEILSSLS